MSKVEDLLQATIREEMKRPLTFLVLILGLTALVSTGVAELEMSSDLKKQLPEVNAIQVDEKASEIAGSEQLLFIYRLDPSEIEETPDIRRPSIIESMKGLEESLEDKPRITGVQGPSSVFASGNVPETLEGVKMVFSQGPADRFFNDDYTAAYMLAETRFPSSEEDINEFESDVRDTVEDASKPGDVEVMVTGQPMLRTEITDLLRQDLGYTTGLAALGLVIVSFAYTRSVKKAFQIVAPLALAMLWLFGTAGFLGIPITISTVIVGAMVMGLGMEYGSFLVERFHETAGSRRDALRESVPLAGDSITGSASTAVIGFSTLAFATIPMIRDMGQMLALGVFYALTLTLFFGPLFILYTERLEGKIQTMIDDRLS